MPQQPASRIVLAGGSGFLGRALAVTLAGEGHQLVVLSRNPARVRPSAARVAAWTPDGSSTGPWTSEIASADVVVNLAGEPLEARRWTAAQKEKIRSSRLLATRSVVSAMARADRPPPLLISASASGYYGPHGDDVVTEETPPGRDFLGRLSVEWEGEASRAASPQTRVVYVRTGIVLGREGGALPKLLPPFRFGVGGPVGSGRQYWPWIHLLDWLGLVRFAIATPSASGPLNASAPNPVTSREFAGVLGSVLRRPSFLPAPAFALRLLLGEMADAVLLSGQRMVPDAATRLGYTFAHAQLEGALRDLLRRPRPA
jgi:uncharacterized protein (TIGR01777 family)